MKSHFDNLLRRILVMCLPTVGPLCMAHPVLADTALAREENLNSACLLRIDGILHDATSCHFSAIDGEAIEFGVRNEETSSGYSVSLTKRDDGQYDGFWHESATDTSPTALGVFSKIDGLGGTCFKRLDSLLCGNIEPDTPIYYIHRGETANEENKLYAFLEGVEFEVSNPYWSIHYPYGPGETVDLDGDGYAETIVEVGFGGNCCPADLSILSYRGDGFFTYLDKEPIPGGWGGYKIVEERGQEILRIFDVPAGHGNTIWQRTQRDFAIVNGHPEMIAERTEVGRPTNIMSLTQDDVKAAQNAEASLDYDINNDGILDELYCQYWDRWGLLNCEASISGLDTVVEMQCRNAAISPIVFGPAKSHRLICDGSVVSY